MPLALILPRQYHVKWCWLDGNNGFRRRKPRQDNDERGRNGGAPEGVSEQILSSGIYRIYIVLVAFFRYAKTDVCAGSRPEFSAK